MPQLYGYKNEKLHELDRKEREGLIALYYADESYVCTEGYVPCGLQLPREEVCFPSQITARLNIFGMIDRKNRYEGFTTAESVIVDKVASFLDEFSFRVNNDTFVVLDNASVHRNHKGVVACMGEKKPFLFLFASIFSEFEYCGNTLANIERKMGQAIGLCEYRHTFLCHHQQSIGGGWKRTGH